MELADMPEEQRFEVLRGLPDRKRRLVEVEVEELTGKRPRKPIRGRIPRDEHPTLREPSLELPSLKRIQL